MSSIIRARRLRSRCATRRRTAPRVLLAGRPAARVVDEHVRAAEVERPRAERARRSASLGDVARDRPAADPALPDEIGGLVRGGPVAVGADHRGTAAGQRDRDLAPEAAARARHHGQGVAGSPSAPR